MFIEIIEYDEFGDKIGKCIINTDDIYYIDNYNEDNKVWELHLGQHENDEINVCFHIKKDGYEAIKNTLIYNNMINNDNNATII